MDELYLSESQYLDDRLEDQINWYSTKSSTAQRCYKRLQLAEIIIAALIPVIGCVSYLITCLSSIATLLMALGGASVVAIEGICKMNKYHENWIQYRYVSEVLKHEKFLFQTKTPPYDDDDAFRILVQRAERAISSENINWVGINEDNQQQRPHSTSS